MTQPAEAEEAEYCNQCGQELIELDIRRLPKLGCTTARFGLQYDAPD